MHIHINGLAPQAFISFFILACQGSFYSYATAEQLVSKGSLPVLSDSSLKVELISEGIQFPTDMAFVNTNDILILEKNNGTVKRIINGTMLQEPVLDVKVANSKERGMLGIAIANNPDVYNSSRYVFLYFTQSSNSDGDDNCPPPDYSCKEGPEPLGNNLYRYELKEGRLVNPDLLLKLPASPGPTHNGGKITIGPDLNIYIGIGDVGGHKTKSQNFRNGTLPDGTSGILRLTQEGQVPNHRVDAIANGGNMTSYYYAHGIRNSFGMDFDPVSGRLWDTENGPEYGDEINLVEPGFNSGWAKVQGIWEAVEGGPLFDFVPGKIVTGLPAVETLGQKYSEPEFIWNETVAPTALKFVDSDKYGDEYENDLLVGDSKRGTIYHFNLNQNRTQLELSGTLTDKIANNMDELEGVIFATGFGGISDIELGPEGYIYVVSYDKNVMTKGYGSIFRIVPAVD